MGRASGRLGDFTPFLESGGIFCGPYRPPDVHPRRVASPNSLPPDCPIRRFRVFGVSLPVVNMLESGRVGTLGERFHIRGFLPLPVTAPHATPRMSEAS